jgi:uncharacterized protein YjdB
MIFLSVGQLSWLTPSFAILAAPPAPSVAIIQQSSAVTLGVGNMTSAIQVKVGVPGVTDNPSLANQAPSSLQGRLYYYLEGTSISEAVYVDLQYKNDDGSGMKVYEARFEPTSSGAYYYYGSFSTDNGSTWTSSAQAYIAVYADANDTTPPGAPTLASIPVASGKAELTWTQTMPNDVAKYLIYRKSGIQAYRLIGTTETTRYTDLTVTNGTSYTYVVTAADNSYNKAYSEEVTVTPTGIDVSSSSITDSVYVGSTLQMSADITPSNAANRTVTWSIGLEGTGQATIDNTGLLSAASAGTVDVIATATDGSGITGTKTITILPVTVTALLANPASMSFVAGTQTGLPVITATYSDNSSKVIGSGIVWSFASSGVALVIDNSLSALNAGNTVLKATYGGQQVDIPVTVSAPVRTHNTDDDSNLSNPKPTEPNPTPGLTDKPETKPTDIFKSDVIEADKVINNIRSRVEGALKSSEPASAPSDIKGHWAEKTIDTFIKLNIIVGYEDGTAKPDASITRAEFAMIISRVFDITGGDKKPELNDVGNHWAKVAIERLAAAGVLGGYGDGTFRPDNYISREEVAIILSRIINLDNVKKDATQGNFNDLSQSYAVDAIVELSEAGVIKGKEDGKFDPRSNSTRAEALTIILNALKLDPDIKTLLESIN